MRKIVITGCVVGALLVAACDEKSSGGSAGSQPSGSASANAATVPAASGSSASPSGSAAAPTKEKEQGPKDHAARAKAFDEAFASGDAKKIAALYAQDAVVKTAGQPDVKGRDAIQKDAEKMFAIFKDAKVIHGRIWEKDKHTAAIESVFTGTNTGDAPEMGIPKATNKTVGVSGASWIEVNDDGLIKEEHRYHDSPTAVGQLMPDKKNPVRPVLTAPPDGMEKYDAKTGHEDSKADKKDDKDGGKKVEEKNAELEKKDLEIENKFLAALNDHKMEDAYKFVGTDILFADYTQPKDLKGLPEFKNVMNMYLTAFPDMKAKMTQSFGDQDFVVGEYEYTGTQKGALGPIKATNKPVDLHQLEIDQFKDGKVVKGWAWGNNLELLNELGVAGEKPNDKGDKGDKGEKPEKGEKGEKGKRRE